MFSIRSGAVSAYRQKMPMPTYHASRRASPAGAGVAAGRGGTRYLSRIVTWPELRTSSRLAFTVALQVDALQLVVLKLERGTPATLPVRPSARPSPVPAPI